MEQEKYFSVGRQREAVRSWERLSSEEKEVRLWADPGNVNSNQYPDPVSTRYVHGVLRQSEGHCPLSRVEPRINSSLREEFIRGIFFEVRTWASSKI